MKNQRMAEKVRIKTDREDEEKKKTWKGNKKTAEFSEPKKKSLNIFKWNKLKEKKGLR